MQVAKRAAKIIRDRTQKGRGVRSLNQNSPNTLKELAPSTIRRRRGKRLSSKTNPSKSNLTETGGMLSNLVGTVRGKMATVIFRDDNSARKAEHVRKDRPFEFLALSEVRALTKYLSELIKRRR